MRRSTTGIALGMVLAAGAGAGVRAGTESGDVESRCLLGSATVAAATGVEIVEVTLSGGAVGSSATGSSLLAPPDLSWSGCDYETADESEFTVAELTGTGDGADGLQQFESLRTLADARDEVGSIVADLSDDAFVTDRGEIVVLDDAQTLRFRVDVVLDVTGIAYLAGVARGMLAVPAPDTSDRCSALVELVPAEWGEPGDAMAGGGTENGFTFESCAVRPAAFEGGTLGVDIAEGRDWYDFELAGEAPNMPGLVEGIGDVAYAYGRVNGFVVLVGDRALVVSGEDADGEPLDPATIESLAVEAATAAGWDPAPTGADTAPGTATTDGP